jgi:hypothetical protein
MPVISAFTTMELAEAEVGSLVGLHLNDSIYRAIKLIDADSEVTLLAVLQATGDFSEPHLLQVHSLTDCVNYGTEWIFEIPAVAEFEFGGEASSYPGSAIITGSSVGLRLGRDPNRRSSSGSILDMETLKLGHKHEPAPAATRLWVVWANAKHRERARGEPLIEHVL